MSLPPVSKNNAKKTKEKVQKVLPSQVKIPLETKKSGDPISPVTKVEVDMVEKSRYLACCAELENYKKRVAKERFNLLAKSNEAMLKGLIPLLDDFQRAIESLKKLKTQEPSLKGITLVQNKLLKTLQEAGLEIMEVVPGDFFDPAKHQALSTMAVEDPNQDNKVVNVVLTGYELNGRPLRVAQVIVGKK